MRISDWSSDVCSSDLSSWTLPWGLEGCKQGEPMLVSRLSLANGACYVAHFRRPLPIAPGDRRRVHRQVAKATRGKRRSEERRVGKECVRTSRSRWSPSHSKKK